MKALAVCPHWEGEDATVSGLETTNGEAWAGWAALGPGSSEHAEVGRDHQAVTSGRQQQTPCPKDQGGRWASRAWGPVPTSYQRGPGSVTDCLCSTKNAVLEMIFGDIRVSQEPCLGPERHLGNQAEDPAEMPTQQKPPARSNARLRTAGPVSHHPLQRQKKHSHPNR